MATDASAQMLLEPMIIEAISNVYDPEIPVNIWELGLIYDLRIEPGGVVTIRMTLTAPACPSAQSLPLEVERKVRELPGGRCASLLHKGPYSELGRSYAKIVQ